MHEVENQTEGLAMKSAAASFQPTSLLFGANPLKMFVSHSSGMPERPLNLLTSAHCSSVFAVLQLFRQCLLTSC